MTTVLSPMQIETLTFEQAIAYTEDLLSNADLTDAELQAAITALIATPNGARGFFVAYLTGDWAIADAPTAGILHALHNVPMPASELLVKNLAMSTATAITHRRQRNELEAKGSERVRNRSAHLIQLLDLDDLRKIASQMYASAQHEQGMYVDFLNKWGYDQQQRAAIAAMLAKSINC